MASGVGDTSTKLLNSKTNLFRYTPFHHEGELLLYCPRGVDLYGVVFVEQVLQLREK